MEFEFYDFRKLCRSDEIDLIFPDWIGSDERVAVFSPHDDDAVLGAAYAILASQAYEAQVFVFIFCDGRAGYSTVAERETIVERRKKETVAAYGKLGIPEENILRYDYPDFSLSPNIGWRLPSGKEGTFHQTLPDLRRLGITRLLLPTGYREHADHEATSRIGAFDGPQVGDDILADWGHARPIRSFMEYAVWGDFSPEDALVSGANLGVRGNCAIVASAKVEARVAEALAEFKSQQRVIADLLRRRKERQHVRKS